MNRRNAIKSIGLGAGITVSVGTLATLFSSCQEEITSDLDVWTPKYFSATDAELVDELTDIILPKTDTPGAKEAKVVRYMDMMIKNVYKAEDQEAFYLGLTGFKNKLKADGFSSGKADLTKMLQKYMVDLSPEQIMNTMNLLKEEAPDPKREGAADEPYYFAKFLKSLKSLAIAGYFGSELIGLNHLNYLPVPGPYQGCIPLTETEGKAWSF